MRAARLLNRDFKIISRKLNIRSIMYQVQTHVRVWYYSHSTDAKAVTLFHICCQNLTPIVKSFSLCAVKFTKKRFLVGVKGP